MTLDNALFLGILAIIVSIITTGSNYLLQRRIQPGITAGTEATTLGSLQGTLASVLDREDKNLTRLDELRQIIQDDKREIHRLTDKIDQLERALSAMTQRAEAAEARAKAAEDRAIAIEERTKDYPHRLELAEAEIVRLQSRAASADTDRATQADTANVLAHNAEANIAEALATPAPGSSTPNHVLTLDSPEAVDSAQAAIDAVSKAIDESE